MRGFIVYEQEYFLMLQDHTKSTIQHKIQIGIQAFKYRFGYAPTVVEVNPAEVIEVDGVEVRARDTVHRNNYWFGFVQVRK